MQDLPKQAQISERWATNAIQFGTLALITAVNALHCLSICLPNIHILIMQTHFKYAINSAQLFRSGLCANYLRWLKMLTGFFLLANALYLHDNYRCTESQYETHNARNHLIFSSVVVRAQSTWCNLALMLCEVIAVGFCSKHWAP